MLVDGDVDRQLSCIYILLTMRYVGYFNENKSLFSGKTFLEVRVVRI